MPCKSQNDRKTAGRILLTPARSFWDDLQSWITRASSCRVLVSLSIGWRAPAARGVTNLQCASRRPAGGLAGRPGSSWHEFSNAPRTLRRRILSAVGSVTGAVRVPSLSGGRRFWARCGAMNAIVLDVFTQDPSQVPPAGDQHQIQALAPGAGNRRDHSHRHKPSNDTARVAIKMISLHPAGRRSSHALAGQDVLLCAGRPAGQPAVSGASGQVVPVFGTHRLLLPSFGSHGQ
jgi:hypothetical protein